MQFIAGPLCCTESAIVHHSQVVLQHRYNADLAQQTGLKVQLLVLACYFDLQTPLYLDMPCKTGVQRASGSALASRRASSRTTDRCTATCCSPHQHTGPDISQLSPHLQQQWHLAKNAHLGNVQITPHNGRKVWWKCDQCPDGYPHEWEATVNNRSHGAGCSCCSNRRACPHNSLATKAPAVAAQFSEKNQGTPHDYTVCSNKKVIWQCALEHEWTARIQERTSGNKTGCPVCHRQQQRSKPQVKQPVLTDSQHACMQYWDWDLNAKAGLHPDRISCKSNKKVNWICPCCPRGQPHRWQAAVANVFSGSGCPCCSGRKACICNSLQSLAPDVAAEWDYTRNKGTPSDYTASSNAKVWWYNDRRGSFQTVIVARTRMRKQQPGN